MPALTIEQAKRSLLVGAARGLDLLRRVPAHFARRGWKPDPDRIAIAEAAICCVKLGCGKTAIRVPPGDELEWSFVDQRGGATASEIVVALGLVALLEPPL